MNIPPRALAGRVFARYDANSDGIITPKEHKAVSITHHPVRMGWDYYQATRTNLGSLFSAADNPQAVTKADIISLFNDFDLDKNGDLNANEVANISAAFPEEIAVHREYNGLCKQIIVGAGTKPFSAPITDRVLR
ncbi:MAG: hypothetical protein CVV27_12225 [Candidatus Melainabacteria bacterium HGW-Melainabacteria-1]|nr:MAG: hypothetical protein CVV27_12225 [Candidatus Melainabacteria bacterium HGW-Melainabacteria-1]